MLSAAARRGFSSQLEDLQFVIGYDLIDLIDFNVTQEPNLDSFGMITIIRAKMRCL